MSRIVTPHLGDLAILAIAGLGAVEVATEARPVWVVAVVFAWYLPLLVLRRRAPLAAPVATGLAVVVSTVVAPATVTNVGAPALATCTSLFLSSAATSRTTVHRRRDLVVLAFLVVASSAATLARSPFPLEEVGLVAALVGVCVGAGWFLPRRIADAERARWIALDAERRFDCAVRDVIAAERQAVARELHDVVARGITVMILQAAAARTLLATDARAAREAIGRVSDAGTVAVRDLRRLYTALGNQPDPNRPQPGLGDLPALLDEFRVAGLTIEAHLPPRGHETGDAALDVTVHRIVQEALTNVLRHAGTTDVEVTVGLTGERVDVEVVDVGPRPGGTSGRRAAPRGTGLGSGHGLVGMRERAALYGGSLVAAPAGDGFAVRATLPRTVAS